MASPDIEKPWREEDVLPTPHFELIDEVKKIRKGLLWTQETPTRMPVINGKTLTGEDAQFVWLQYNLPLNLRTEKGFNSAATFAAHMLSMGVEIRYGKPVDREVLIKGRETLTEVPLAQEGVGIYIQREKLTAFGMVLAAGLYTQEAFDKRTSTEEGHGRFLDKLGAVLPTIPRFYRQMRLPLRFDQAPTTG